MSEIWINILGYEGVYQASNYGHIKSMTRTVKHSKGGNMQIKERILKPTLGTNKYYTVCLCKNYKKYFLVHRLVLSTFDRIPLGNEECNHIDGNKTNNNLLNLKWVTRSENLQHARKVLGIKYGAIGQQHGSAKLTRVNVIEIRRLHTTGKHSQKELANIFNMGQSQISQIVNRKSWTHI